MVPPLVVEVCCVCVSVSLCVMYESYACEPGGAL